MTYKLIKLDRVDGVARLTLDDPGHLNPMTLAMGLEIDAAVEALNTDDDVRAVIVTGAGKAFSAGGSLATLAREAGMGEDGEEMGGGRVFYSAFLAVRRLRVPTIAAINGHAIGAGLCFALGCDLRIAHERAKMGMTFVKLGIHPGMAATWNLPRIIGPAAAADLLYTGRLIDAREALAIGLVGRMAGDDFANVVDATAAAIASNGPVAIRLLKETLSGTAGRTIEEALGREADAQARTFETDDAREGIRAVQEKRSPHFKGR
ncbi:MAG: enoyl-CoA hydratase/isomerase family protein [Myxococcales bacterium]|nr:MAG: enoyl-CoA hydratase/isomerase family protein [Myxococcales bacterium]